MARTQIRGSSGIMDASIPLAKLDTSIIFGGKLLASLLPAAVVGAMVYQGTWDASTNTPAIPAAAAGNQGQYYVVGVTGTTLVDGVSDWVAGDWIVSDGVQWDKIDNSEKTETAATTAFNNVASGLTATDVQGAIDELDTAIDAVPAAIAAAVAAIPAAKVYTRETPAGAVDGVNTDFTLTSAPSAGTLQLYLNGQLQELTDDYTLVGAVATMVSAPLASDKVRAIYYV